MRTDMFMHETSGVSRVLGRKEQLKVVFAGDQAGTDGNTVVLPALPGQGEIDDKHARVMRGYVDHEALHLRHTDFGVFKSIDQSTPKGQALKAWCNAIEDMRIEALGIAEYRGMADNIGATAEAANEAAVEAIKTHPITLGTFGALAITWEGRRRNGLAVASNESLLAQLPADLRAKVGAWCDQLPHLRSTADALTLAEAILADMAKGEAPKPKPQPEGQPGKDNGHEGGEKVRGKGKAKPGAEAQECSGDDGQGTGAGGEGDEDEDEGDGADTNDGDDEGDGDAYSEDGSGDDDVEAGDEGAGGVGGGSSDPTVKPLSAELQEGVNHVAKKIVGDGTSGKYTPLTMADDWWVDERCKSKDKGYRTWREISNPAGVQLYDRFVRKAQGTTSVMRRKLERMVMAEQRVDWDGGRSQGRLDSRRLVAASMGNPYVYRTRMPARALDTAVCMLVDLSGSMRGERIMLANQIVIAMSQALETISVPHAVLGFHTSSYGDHGQKVHEQFYRDYAAAQAAYKPAPPHPEALYGRLEAVTMYEYKSFDAKLRDRRAQLAHIHTCINGANADGDSVLYAWSRLRQRRESRRIMLVLSDGAPACSGNGTSVPYLKDVVQALERNGFETYGIGIQSTEVRRFYPRYVVANSLNEFAGKSMDALAQLLLGGRARVSVAA